MSESGLLDPTVQYQTILRQGINPPNYEGQYAGANAFRAMLMQDQAVAAAQELGRLRTAAMPDIAKALAHPEGPAAYFASNPSASALAQAALLSPTQQKTAGEAATIWDTL